MALIEAADAMAKAAHVDLQWAQVDPRDPRPRGCGCGDRGRGSGCGGGRPDGEVVRAHVIPMP